MNHFIVGSFFFATWLNVCLSQALPNPLILSATYRDFLPSACIFRTTDGLSKIRTAWGLNNNLNAQASCDLLLQTGNAAQLQWRNAILNGDIQGHPDFNAHGFFTNRISCESTDNTKGNLNFPAGTCMFDSSGNFIPNSNVVGLELVLQPNGLLKPVYCTDVNGDASSCGFTSTTTKTQSNKAGFDLWYVDNSTFNRRVGQRIALRLSDPVAGTFSFSSKVSGDVAAFDHPADNVVGFFGPLNSFEIGGSKEIPLTVAPEDSPAWPQSQSGLGKSGFWFTTELHTTFVYRANGDMRFSFIGDDDFWAFVNGKMVIDLGGMHPAREATIDLNLNENGFNLPNFLGLEDGNVYTLDIFHAERATTESNFAVTTNLASACNVLLSGVPSFDLSSALQFKASDFVVNGGASLSSGGVITLQTAAQLFSASSIFTVLEQNVLRGFIANFTVTVSEAETNGFAFVVQAMGLDDYPTTSGDSFNIAGLTNSIAVVFDLCTDRSLGTCKAQEVRVHFPGSPEDSNNASQTAPTKTVFEGIQRNLKNNAAFNVEIIYFGGAPDFLEVYIDRSLFVRQSNFKIAEVIGSGGAHVGFTTSSANKAANIEISDFVFKTVQVEPELTVFAEATFNSTNLQTVLADGISRSEGFRLVTFDFCTNQLESGTLDDLVSVAFIELVNASTGFYFNNALTPEISSGFVQDNGDGTYSVQLNTTVPGFYSLAVSFGEGCEVAINTTTGENNIEIRRPVLSKESESSRCFFSKLNGDDAVVFASEVLVDPTAAPISFEDESDESQKIILISSIGGGLFLVGCVVLVTLLFFKRKWDAERKFIESGNMYRLDLNTQYNGNDEYNRTGKRLLETQREILALKNTAKNDSREGDIEQLTRENEEMRGIIKANKVTKNLHIENKPEISTKSGKKKNKTEV